MKKILKQLNKDLYPMNLIQLGFLMIFAILMIITCILPEGTLPYDPACRYDPTCGREDIK